MFLTVILCLVVGAFLGFVGSIPVAGPISVLVLAMGVRSRVRAAIGVAAGGAVAEAFYAFLAFWGFSTYLARYPVVVEVSRGITCLILLTIGILLVRPGNQNSTRKANPIKQGSRSGFLLGFMISILNPTLILTWVAASNAVFAAQIVPFGPREAVPFSVGVCLGIVAWFGLLLGVIARYRGNFRPESLSRVEFWMGVAVLAGTVAYTAIFIRGLLS